jgi:hypothetical protein
MLTIRKSLIAAAALALMPAFALAQTSGEVANAPATVTSSQCPSDDFTSRESGLWGCGLKDRILL